MQPFLTLARARTSDGSELSLHRHGNDFQLRVNGQVLMGTHAPESECRLAELACTRLPSQGEGRVLIGGLGFGYSLRQVLDLAAPHTLVHVVELLPEIVAWNREFLATVNGRSLDDPRVHLTIGDVIRTIADAPASHYDAMLLDVDNGPTAMVQHGNAFLYQPAGLAAINRTLKPGGRVTFWSAGEDPAFTKRLLKAGFAVEVVTVRARRHTHTVFVADRRR
jgi:spermidine synthase